MTKVSKNRLIREKRRELWCWREGHVGANLFSADLTKSIIAILGPALPLNQIASIHMRISLCRLFSKLPGKFLFLTFRQGSCVALCSVIASDRLFGLNISSYFPSSPFPSLHLFLSISTDSWLVPNPEWLWPPLSTPGVQLLHLIFPTFAGLFPPTFTTTALILYYIFCLICQPATLSHHLPITAVDQSLSCNIVSQKSEPWGSLPVITETLVVADTY